MNKFDKSYLKQDETTFCHGTVVNLYIVYKKNTCYTVLALNLQ